MASNIDPTKPVEGNATTASVRSNFAAAKAEIEALQAAGQTFPLVNFFSYLTAAEKADVLAGSVGLNLASKLQAAIDAVAATSSYAGLENGITLVIPGGVVRVDTQITLKTGVRLRCEGTLWNGLASNSDPVLVTEPGSHIEILNVNGNAKGGVTLGSHGVQQGTHIGTLYVYNCRVAVGLNVAGVRFLGTHFTFDRIIVETADFGVQFGDNSSGVSQYIRGNFMDVRDVGSTGVQGYLAKDICISAMRIVAVRAVPIAQFTDCDRVVIFDMLGRAGRGVIFNSSTTNTSHFLRARLSNTDIASALSVSNIINSFFEVDVVSDDLGLDGGVPSSGPIAFFSNTCTGTRAVLRGRHGSTITNTANVPVDFTWCINDHRIIYTPISVPEIRFTQSEAKIEESEGVIAGFFVGNLNADQSIASNTVLADISWPSAACSVQAHEDFWHLQYILEVGSALATTGLKLGLNVDPNVSLSMSCQIVPDNVAAGQVLYKYSAANPPTLDFTAANLAGIGSAKAIVDIYCDCTSGLMVDDTIIKLKTAQSTSSATAMTVKKGSRFQAAKWRTP